MLSACELILEGKAKPGDTVGLLWREELNHPFTSRITFDAAGKAVSRCQLQLQHGAAGSLHLG